MSGPRDLYFIIIIIYSNKFSGKLFFLPCKSHVTPILLYTMERICNGFEAKEERR